MQENAYALRDVNLIHDCRFEITVGNLHEVSDNGQDKKCVEWFIKKGLK